MYWLAAPLLLLLLTGACTSMHPLHLGPEQLGELEADEGLVFGSVRVEVTDEESGGLFGRNAEDFRYRITLLGPREDRDGALFTDEWQVFVHPGEERVFVARLPAGDLALGGARPTPFFGSEFLLSGSFTVDPTQPTYIGRLVLTFPARLGSFTEVDLRVDDTHEIRPVIDAAYGDLTARAKVDLIEVRNDRARLNTNRFR